MDEGENLESEGRLEQKPEGVVQVDKSRVASSFGRAAERYDSVAYLQRLVADQLLEWAQLSDVTGLVLDVGCGTGYVAKQVLRDYPALACLGLDIAEGMLQYAQRDQSNDAGKVHWLCADAERLPLADSSIAAAVSNFALQWCPNLSNALTEVFRVLVPGGRLLMTLPAHDTLRELKESWRRADTSYSHVNEFPDEERVLRDIAAGGLRVRRAARISRCAYYPSVVDLTMELKTLGAQNATLGRNRAMTSKRRYQDMLAHYERFRCANGKLPATWRILAFELEKPRD
ncbi:Biotin synthesis protein [gamma proteobacterium HdN1]|nr:Biotin synthesis protein [gamma proteobacterium HdN1]